MAGADGILIHSKSHRPDEILEFAKEWSNRLPLAIVPTKYYSTPTNAFRKANISLVIWANHMIRSSTKEMIKNSKKIYKSESVADIEEKISTVDKIFNLQGVDELSEAQERYLGEKIDVSAIVLAATRGSELHELTQDKPKAMINIGGEALLARTVKQFKKIGIINFAVVAGYKAESINVSGIDIKIN